jgi:hypothetical protein
VRSVSRAGTNHLLSFLNRVSRLKGPTTQGRDGGGLGPKQAEGAVEAAEAGGCMQSGERGGDIVGPSTVEGFRPEGPLLGWLWGDGSLLLVSLELVVGSLSEHGLLAG